MILLGTIKKETDTNINNKIEKKTTTWTKVYLESSKYPQWSFFTEIVNG